ncbi:MAG: NfeD family protein [Thermoplasmata archaeon]|nr:MAG: NfeD family protein [Thermoplasmata archaeon]
MGYWWIWIILAIILIIIEISTTPEFDALYFGIGCMIAGIVAFFGFSLIYQILAFAISIIILLFTFHKIAKTTLYRSKEETETNIHALKGKKGVVTQKIDNLQFTGRVKIGGEEWKAKSIDDETIDENSPIIIVGVEGNKVLVKREER